MLAIAVLAVLTISFVSFTNATSPSKTDDQTGYVWIRWGCGAYGSANPMIGYYSTQSPDMLIGDCPEQQPSGVCAIRFDRSEVTCHEDLAWTLPGVNPWAPGRMIKYCPR